VKSEIIYGIHPVSEALTARRRNFFEIYIAEKKISKRVEAAVALAESLHIPIRKISSSQLRSNVNSDMHQGIGAKVSSYPLVDIFDFLNKTEHQNRRHFVLILDNIVDPHNLGALIRTANCVGIDGVIIPKNRSAPPSPAVSKASSGALEHIMLSRVTNLVSVIRHLAKKGIWIVGTEKTADGSLFDCDLTGSVAIIIGGEEKGIRPLVKKYCDFLISIPQTGRVNSLNASAAGAVVMYEAFRQRQHVNTTTSI